MKLQDKLVNKVKNDTKSFLSNSTKDLNSNHYIFNGTTMSIVIQTNNLSSLIESRNNSLPILNYDKCENTLKNKEKIKNSENLIISNIVLKYDSFEVNNKDALLKSLSSIPNIFTENGTIIDDNQCDKYDIKFPIDNELINITEYEYILQNYGFDIFNPSDPFYHEKCKGFQYYNNTDYSIEYRRKKFSKEFVCVNNGTFKGIDLNKYGTCEYVKLPKESKLYAKKAIFSELNNSNFRLFLCISNLFKNIHKNISFWVFIVITSLTISCFIAHKYNFKLKENLNKIHENDIEENKKNNSQEIDNMDVDKKLKINQENNSNKNQDNAKNNYRVSKFNSNSNSNIPLQYQNNDYKHNDDIQTDEKSNNNNSEIIIGNSLEKSPKNTVININNYYINVNSDNVNKIKDVITKIEDDNQNNDNKFKNKFVNTEEIYENNKEATNEVVNEPILNEDNKITNLVNLDTEKEEIYENTDDENNSKTRNKNATFLQIAKKNFVNEIDFLNLIFIVSSLHPFYIRLFSVYISVTLLFTLNAMFFNDGYVNNETDNKNLGLDISFNFVILEEFFKILWPILIEKTYSICIDIIIKPSNKEIEEFIKDMSEATDENVKKERM